MGQSGAVSHLISAARRPVHAYLLHGPPGSGKRAAARALAAALLCPDGGCNQCNTCRRALAGTHPDLVVVERTGASVDIDEARSIVTRAQRRPLEAARQVLVVADVHLADKAAPALLKTVEEPPPATVFVLLADELPPAWSRSPAGASRSISDLSPMKMWWRGWWPEMSAPTMPTRWPERRGGG